MKKYKPRKKLRCSDEEAFQLLLLAFGPPDKRTREFSHHVVNPKYGSFMYYGVSAWMEYSDEGRLFMRMVRDMGEAKIRVHLAWRRYLRWWEARS
jgi:hypothetical protein